MNGRLRPSLCERSRSWAALAPDGELSELEQKLLESHLARCAACAAFSVQVAAVAEELRAAALQPIRRPVAVPGWHRKSRTAYARVRAVGAAAAVAVMALGIAARAPLATEPQRESIPRVVDFSGGDQAEIQRLQTLRTAQLVAEQQRRNRPAQLDENQPA